MSLKHSYTTADYLEWDTAMNLIRKLFRDGDYRMSLLLGCGCFFGLRISDILSLTWDMILNTDSFHLIEKKTSKHREIKISPSFKGHIRDCYEALNSPKTSEPCFLSRKHQVYCIQQVNRKFKTIKAKYGIKIDHFSSHTMRKTMGRHVVEMAGPNSEMALIKLSELYGHSSPAISRKYLGLRRAELMEVYDSLMF